MKSWQLWETFLCIIITAHLFMIVKPAQKKSGKQICPLDSVVFSKCIQKKSLQRFDKRNDWTTSCTNLKCLISIRLELTTFKRLKWFLKVPILKCIFDEVLFSKHGLRLTFTNLSVVAFWILHVEIGNNWQYWKKQHRQSFAVPLKKRFSFSPFLTSVPLQYPLKISGAIEVELFLKMG